VRYYVLCVSDFPDIPAYVIAEVVRDPLDADDRETSLAAGLVGERALIVTRHELMETPEGRRALDAWDVGDDSTFNLENRHIRATVDVNENVRHLHLVDPAGDVPEREPEVSFPLDEWRREVLIKAFGLREISRQLQREARRRRDSLREVRDAGKRRREHA